VFRVSGDEILSGARVALVADRSTALVGELAYCGARVVARGTGRWRRDGSRWASELDVTVASRHPRGVIQVGACALAVADD
jgi:hypothetical protein